MAESNKMKDMPVNQLMIQMGIPMILSMALQAVYNIVDSAFVGNMRVGSEAALNALTLVFPIQMLMVAVGIGTGVGTNALLARMLGQGNNKKAAKAAGNSLFLGVIIYVVCLLFGLFGVNAYIASQTVDPEVISMGTEYLRICCVISFGIVFFSLFEKLLQATGRSFYSTIGQVVGAVVNIILDPLMIFGIGPFPEMGIRGAALATVIGQIFGMLLGLWGVFRQQKVLNVNMREFKWRGQTIKDIYRVGLPGIVMQSVVSVMTAGMNGILIAFSQTAVNVLGVYFKLQTFVFMPVFGLNQGALPVMGYNYGARNRKRLMGAYKITLTAAVVIMGLGLVLFQLLPEQMLMLFVDKSDAAAAQEMIEVGVPALKTISLSFLGAAFGIINSTLFQATARGMNSLIVSVCRQLVVILPAAWSLGQQFGLNAVWCSFPIAEIAAFFISYILLWREYRTELRFLGIEREAKA